jgi:hypothetical protein
VGRVEVEGEEADRVVLKDFMYMYVTNKTVIM